MSVRDVGDYQITIELKEIYRGTYMPGIKTEFTVRVLPPAEVEPEPEPEKPKSDEEPPFAKITEILMDGKMKLVFSRALNFEPNLLELMNKDYRTGVPVDIYNPYQENQYEQMIKLSFIAGN